MRRIRGRRATTVCLLGLLLAFSGAYCVRFWTKNAQLFIAFYRPENLFRMSATPASHSEEKSHILRSLNEELEQDSGVASGKDLGMLARLDKLWHSVRRYLSPRPTNCPIPRLARSRVLQPEGKKPRGANTHQETEPQRTVPRLDTGEILHDVVALALEPDRLRALPSAEQPPAGPEGLPNDGSRAEKQLQEDPARPFRSELFYHRLESLEGLRTRTLIWQLNRNLALEGTVESAPQGDTDPDLADFGFRTVHALSFLRDCRVPSTLAGREGVDSGYPLSYGIGLNYRISPSMSIRFDYAHESPNDSVIEYRGSWERSLVARYDKHSAEDVVSIHNFFLGLRYLYRQHTVGVPLQTGFFYATNMADDPLSSDVSLGFTIGGGINQKDFRIGFAYRFRIWDNPDTQLLKQEAMQDLGTRLSNQFLLTIVF